MAMLFDDLAEMFPGAGITGPHLRDRSDGMVELTWLAICFICSRYSNKIAQQPSRGNPGHDNEYNKLPDLDLFHGPRLLKSQASRVAKISRITMAAKGDRFFNLSSSCLPLSQNGIYAPNILLSLCQLTTEINDRH
jgi:hypothetical protein